MTDELVKTLKDYQREYERLIINMPLDTEGGRYAATISNFNTVQSANPMEQLGFNQIAISHINQYDQAASASLRGVQELGVPIMPRVEFRNVEVLQMLKQIDLASMTNQARELDLAIKHELVNMIALETPEKQAVQSLAANLLGRGESTGRLAAYANTYMRTALFGLSRTIESNIYQEAGIEEYVYAGPIDGVTRPFCKARIGQTFTKEEIEQFGAKNGSGLSGFYAPGGWNCRHSMVPRSIVDAVELA